MTKFIFLFVRISSLFVLNMRVYVIKMLFWGANRLKGQIATILHIDSLKLSLLSLNPLMESESTCCKQVDSLKTVNISNEASQSTKAKLTL